MTGIKKSLWTVLSIMLVAALALAGCGSNGSNAGSGKGAGTGTNSDGRNNAEEPAKQETITMMTTGWWTTAAPEEYGKKIEEATGVKVNFVLAPTNPDDMVAKKTTILSSGDDTVDILFTNDELITAFSRAGYLEPLQNDVMTPEVAGQFSEQYLKDIATYEGQIYSVPSFLEVLALWVNQELFNKAGLKPPTNQDEFLAAAKALTKDGVYGYGGSWEKSYVFNEIGTFINLFGGDYFDWTNPKTQQALQFLYDMANKDKVTPLAQLADIYDPMIQKFIDGKYGMIYMYSGAIPTFEKAGKFGPGKLEMVPIPTFETDDMFMASWHYVLSKASKKKEASKKVLQYLASKEGQLAYSELSSRLPARLDIINDPNFKGVGVDYIRGYIANSTLRGRPLVPQTMEFVNGIGSIFQKYVSDENDLSKTVELAQKEIERLAKR
ncbi:MAG TPA: extracellular solute-binding protein [Paenibacillus sp.]|uniref:ABC transporter substrate-binding protein n=1 Tax=Paenibacillus sp. TaxID=58172 RepID=UPI002CF08190|nr:extracellular solute-binding protein [Paenibacillus sp.]HUC91405.1 extracellular solute-binding protein [Paenibacillus sp.]